MFWGLIMEPKKRYTHTINQPFHVSMASLDAASADDNIVQVMLCHDNKTYLLCTLKKGTVWQVPLDLNFEQGAKIAFTSNGHGHVHLTGYYIPEDDLNMDDLGEEEEEEEEEEVDQTPEKQTKRKAPENEKKAKRAKQEEVEEESSDDDDLDGLNEDDDSEDLEDEDELMENAEEEEDSDEEEEEEEKPQKQMDKKSKQQQKKEDKKKVVNGKEVKHEQQQQNKEQKKKKGEQQQQNVQAEPKKRVIEGGVQVEDLKVGNGQAAKPGRFVSVYYVGRLKNGKKFDSTTQGDGFKFRLGKGEVIRGWDVGIAGMKVGGKRRLTIPPALAYGAKGSPPVIPGNSTLTFEVELRNVH